MFENSVNEPQGTGKRFRNFADEQFNAPENSESTLVWIWNDYHNDYLYNGVTPGLTISSRVNEAKMDEFFEELKNIPHQNKKDLCKSYIIGFIIVFIFGCFNLYSFFYYLETYTNMTIGISVVSPLPFLLVISFIIIFCKAYTKRRRAIDSICRKFTKENLAPFYKSCTLTVSKRQSYVILHDSSIPQTPRCKTNTSSLTKFQIDLMNLSKKYVISWPGTPSKNCYTSITEASTPDHEHYRVDTRI